MMLSGTSIPKRPMNQPKTLCSSCYSAIEYCEVCDKPGCRICDSYEALDDGGYVCQFCLVNSPMVDVEYVSPYALCGDVAEDHVDEIGRLDDEWLWNG